MKSIKKLFAMGLAVMMALSIPFSVSAAELEDAPIDESRTGSLTIYKYDLTNAEKDGVWDALEDDLTLGIGGLDGDKMGGIRLVGHMIHHIVNALVLIQFGFYKIVVGLVLDQELHLGEIALAVREQLGQINPIAVAGFAVAQSGFAAAKHIVHAGLVEHAGGHIGGMEDDTYTMTEVRTDSGYVMLKQGIDVVISKTETTGLCYIYESDVLGLIQNDPRYAEIIKDTGNLKNMPQKHLEHKLMTASAAVDGKKVNMVEDNGSVNAEAPLTVVNTRGFDLPKTGDHGTWMYSIGGVLLMAVAASAMFFALRKKGSVN